jgi:hypothetical protein
MFDTTEEVMVDALVNDGDIMATDEIEENWLNATKKNCQHFESVQTLCVSTPNDPKIGAIVPYLWV